MNSDKLSDTDTPHVEENTEGRSITIILNELFKKTGVKIFYESEKDVELLEELYKKTGIKIDHKCEGRVKKINVISTELDELLPKFYKKKKRSEYAFKKDKDIMPKLKLYLKCSMCEYRPMMDTADPGQPLSNITSHCMRRNHKGSKIMFIDNRGKIIDEVEPNINNVSMCNRYLGGGNGGTFNFFGGLLNMMSG